MGVMRCNRHGCGNIMCHHMLDGHYICTDCLSEVERKRKGWPEQMSAVDVRRYIQDFFDSEPDGGMVETEVEFERLHTRTDDQS